MLRSTFQAQNKVNENVLSENKVSLKLQKQKQNKNKAKSKKQKRLNFKGQF